MKNYLKLSLFCLALVLIISGCAQKNKTGDNGKANSHEKIASSTTQEVATTSALSNNIVVSKVGDKKKITHNKHKFTLFASGDVVIVNDYLPSENAVEAFRVGDLSIVIATGTIKDLNKGFFEEDASMADSGILKNEKIAVSSRQIGQAYFYDHVTTNYSAHGYSFLIPVNDGKNVLILKMGYNGELDKKDFFKEFISKISIE